MELVVRDSRGHAAKWHLKVGVESQPHHHIKRKPTGLLAIRHHPLALRAIVQLEHEATALPLRPKVERRSEAAARLLRLDRCVVSPTLSREHALHLRPAGVARYHTKHVRPSMIRCERLDRRLHVGLNLSKGVLKAGHADCNALRMWPEALAEPPPRPPTAARWSRPRPVIAKVRAGATRVLGQAAKS